MKKKGTSLNGIGISKNTKPPEIEIKKLGIVSHDYRYKEDNGYRDFSHAFSDILNNLDNKYCDSVLFSLFTIVQRKTFKINNYLNDLKNIKSIFIEEFVDSGGNNRTVKRNVIYYETSIGWQEYELLQKFGTLEYTNSFRNKIIEPFIEEVRTQRIFGNFTILLCGETNIVKYSKKGKNIVDKYNYMKVIPGNVNIFLNPIHDLMKRPEMKLKRQYLSKNKKWVISVWNKGKRDKNGRVMDGTKPAWTVFHNSKDKEILVNERCAISSKSNIEIGILDIKNE